MYYSKKNIKYKTVKEKNELYKKVTDEYGNVRFVPLDAPKEAKRKKKTFKNSKNPFVRFFGFI